MRLLLSVVCGLALAGCASTQPVKVQTEPVAVNVFKPSAPRSVNLKNVNWMVVTKENLPAFLEKQSKSQNSDNPVFVAITMEDYKTINMNLAELKRYIAQQKSIIVYYEKAVTSPEKAAKAK